MEVNLASYAPLTPPVSSSFAVLRPGNASLGGTPSTTEILGMVSASPGSLAALPRSFQVHDLLLFRSVQWLVFFVGYRVGSAKLMIFVGAFNEYNRVSMEAAIWYSICQCHPNFAAGWCSRPSMKPIDQG